MRILLLAITLFLITAKSNALSVEQDQTAEQITIIDSYSNKLYGSWLFEGGFSQSSFSGINPQYHVSQGDTLLLQLWGGIDYQSEAKVDPQGNIFVPKVGPIKVQGVTNKELNTVVLKAVKRVYKSNVEAYVTLL